MKLKVPTQQLQSALHKVLGVVSTRTTIPVLSNVWVKSKDGRLTLATTDLEVSCATSIAAEIETEGEITLPAKRFDLLARNLLGDNVSVDVGADFSTQLRCGAGRFRIMGMDASEFPKEGEFQEERRLTLTARDFGKILRKIAYCVSTDQTRYVLNGILVSVREGNCTAVATDGRRLALVEKILDDATPATEGDAILPIKVVKELQRLLDVDGELTIRFSAARAVFAVGDTTLTTKLVEGTYPNYRQVIPASFKNSVVLPRQTFLSVLSSVSTAVADTTASVKFKLEPGKVTLSAASTEVPEGVNEFEVSYSGDPVTIAFNPNFLKEPLQSLECDEITMRFNDEFKPVVLLGDEGFLCVIMPMRN